MIIGHGGLLIYRSASRPRSFLTPPTISVSCKGPLQLQMPRKDLAGKISEPQCSELSEPAPEGPWPLYRACRGAGRHLHPWTLEETDRTTQGTVVRHGEFQSCWWSDERGRGTRAAAHCQHNHTCRHCRFRLRRRVLLILQASSDVMCLCPKPGLFCRLQFIHRINHEKRGHCRKEAIPANLSADLCEGRGSADQRFPALAALSLVPLI